ncbi:hypothetical protein lpg1256 [Legionella pneumophila subsp. pneumophila str. Philadelphia 1]|uniref:Uncharacterized protein n=1 Tax=Legionella pneumophila subsp. pneumophila (strain Philadelphia 1 / ATCC 33152 / DSM 7513) TaxID=272624 RepID=Q5ZW31_LEGPH|nr:hypothetical protein lpg1256 [Legionella pneumophila subsp. pneumophila str. Philadelphia 1]
MTCQTQVTCNDDAKNAHGSGKPTLKVIDGSVDDAFY